MVKVLVTGGAGYIGSAAVKILLNKGHEVVVADNLSKGIHKLVDERAKFYQGDLVDEQFVEKLFDANEFDVIMHFAGYKVVEESVQNPEKYCDNITSVLNILDRMVDKNVKKIIFSSSAAVYGNPEYMPMDENHPTKPMNFYGFTKLECEKIINLYSQNHGIIGVNLRYFNVVGDAGLSYLDPDPKNVLPLIIESLFKKRGKFMINGDDYDTSDGTCVRDYIDVNDLVEAHILALNLETSATINLGTAEGVSVLELVKTVEKVSGKKLSYFVGPRREGDPSEVFASNKLALALLGWKPKMSITNSIRSTLSVYDKL